MIKKIIENFYKYYVDKFERSCPILVNPTFKEISCDIELPSWEKHGEVRGLLTWDGDKLYVFDGYFLHFDVMSFLGKSLIPLVINNSCVDISPTIKEQLKRYKVNIEKTKELVKKSSALNRLFRGREFKVFDSVL